jgi:predicted metalloprotease with PDZ domain
MREYVRDGGFLICFLLDVRLRSGSNGKITLGDLLAATRGVPVTNQLLRTEAARLAPIDVAPLFAQSVEGAVPPPLPAEAVRCGLEMADTGTGEPFSGMTLEDDEPIIARVQDPGPAISMGLRSGDRLLTIGGAPIRTAAQAAAALAAVPPGEAIEVSVTGGDGQIFTVMLTLWERVTPVLRRSGKASLAGAVTWDSMVRGDVSTFLN